MSEPIFLDTSFVLALLNKRDAHHEEALALYARVKGAPLLTTDAILMEIGNACARMSRSSAASIIRYLLEAENVRVIHVTPQLIRRGLELYEKYTDKTWGLVDCISFVVMREQRITSALAFDTHFIQAGFRLLQE